MEIVKIGDGVGSKKTKIWSVGSGKGGVGKSFVSSSLSITLAKLGHSVVLVDLDSTGANSHTCLGMAPSHLNLRHYFEGSKTLNEILIPTKVPKMSLAQGLWDSWNLFDLTTNRVERLFNDMRNLPADYVVVDLGAGATHGNIEVFKRADERILLTSPEPTGLEKNYRFIEAFICSEIQNTTTPANYLRWLQALRQRPTGPGGQKFSIKGYMAEHMPESLDHFHTMNKNPLNILVNSVRSLEQESLGYSIRSVCRKYFDLETNFVGSLSYDNAVWQSLKNYEPALIAQPFTPLAGQFMSVCKQLIDPADLRAVV